jgi:hypothetical protein
MILPGNERNTLPKIIFEEMKGTIIIRGRSISSEVPYYFKEFLTYLEDCLLKNPMNLEIDIDLEYFSTETARELMRFFKIVKIVKEKNFEININWFIEGGDEDLRQAGEDYQDITKLNFNIIEKTE